MDPESTELLVQLRDGRRAAADRLFERVYDALHAVAVERMRHETPGGTMQATAVVHEAYLKLIDQSRVDWQGKTHFLAVGAQAIRRILIDHARARCADKRGGGWDRITCDPSVSVTAEPETDIIALHEALERLATLDEQQSKIVEMRVFGGMTVEEVAKAVGVSPRTVEGDWAMARAWLKRELSKGDSR